MEISILSHDDSFIPAKRRRLTKTDPFIIEMNETHSWNFFFTAGYNVVVFFDDSDCKTKSETESPSESYSEYHEIENEYEDEEEDEDEGCY
jgi:hypothetical protein